MRVITFEHLPIMWCPNSDCDIDILPPGERRCPKCGTRAKPMPDTLEMSGIPSKGKAATVRIL